MDAAVAVDAKNAPTATWKTAQRAVFHSAHTQYHLVDARRPESTALRRQPASHTKILTLPGELDRGFLTAGPEFGPTSDRATGNDKMNVWTAPWPGYVASSQIHRPFTNRAM